MNTDSVLDSYPNTVLDQMNTDSDPEIHNLGFKLLIIVSYHPDMDELRPRVHNPGLIIKVYHPDLDELRLHGSTTLVY